MPLAPSDALVQKAERILYGSKVATEDGVFKPYVWMRSESSTYTRHMSLKVEALRGEGYGGHDPAVAVVDREEIQNMKQALLFVSQRDGLGLQIDTERAPRVFIDRGTFDQKMPDLMAKYEAAQPDLPA
jgi:hypothetical protein